MKITKKEIRQALTWMIDSERVGSNDSKFDKIIGKIAHARRMSMEDPTDESIIQTVYNEMN